LALGSAGCENKHIGRTCDLNADAGTTSGTGSTATINPEALECPSRICILPAASGATDTTSLCTADCSSDDDCSDGETGPKANATDHHCESGFVCTYATTVGDFCCRKFCLCKDFTGPPPSGGFPTPTICQAGMNSSCKNVPP
jgi:hypothetical protein